MSSLIDLAGQTFGRLTVLSRAARSSKKAFWHCRCECGNAHVARGTHLRSGQIRSCGCLVKHHGHSSNGQLTATYISWRSMHSRCKSTHPKREWYADRGITVCESWGSFSEFLKDMGERPTGKTLDRIDPDEGYYPGNCRWATHHEQATNRRPRKRHDEPLAAESKG